MTILPAIDAKLDLTFSRFVDLLPEKIWAAWTQPKLLLQWFTPAPWTTTECDIDLTPGGTFRTVMQSPEGDKHYNTGCYLEIVENRKLVWTDAMLTGYRPAAKPFLTAFILLEPQNGGTLYTAIARHATEADCQNHREMGFEIGWNAALDQLIALMKKI